ncbi:MAG: hypothetical protein WDN28_07020 [Chthoniobacter sp.]
MPTPDASLPRRRFLQTLAAAGAVNLLPHPMPAAESTPSSNARKLKLGFDNFSSAASAGRLLARSNTPRRSRSMSSSSRTSDSYESLEDGYLRDQAKKAQRSGPGNLCRRLEHLSHFEKLPQQVGHG